MGTGFCGQVVMQLQSIIHNLYTFSSTHDRHIRDADTWTGKMDKLPYVMGLSRGSTLMHWYGNCMANIVADSAEMGPRS